MFLMNSWLVPLQVNDVTLILVLLHVFPLINEL